jgi:hypothetical protein
MGDEDAPGNGILVRRRMRDASLLFLHEPSLPRVQRVHTEGADCA